MGVGAGTAMLISAALGAGTAAKQGHDQKKAAVRKANDARDMQATELAAQKEATEKQQALEQARFLKEKKAQANVSAMTQLRQNNDMSSVLGARGISTAPGASGGLTGNLSAALRPSV